MANVKRGISLQPQKYLKHLRDCKHIFWSSERVAAIRQIICETL